MHLLYAFIAGGLFGAGLFVSGMTDTSKVQGWLDVFGAWDPTLAFVMGGAIIPMAIAWRLIEGRKPLVGGAFPEPSEPRLGRNLVLGSTMFGAGWGLARPSPRCPMVASGTGCLSRPCWPEWRWPHCCASGWTDWFRRNKRKLWKFVRSPPATLSRRRSTPRISE